MAEVVGNAVWIVVVGDREKHFPNKARALAWLKDLTADKRISSATVRRGKGAYTFYGPCRGEHVVSATLDRVSFTALAKRARKPLFDSLEA